MYKVHEAELQHHFRELCCVFWKQMIKCVLLCLFSELGIDYCPPSQYLLPVLEHDSGTQNTDTLDSIEEAWKVQCVIN